VRSDDIGSEVEVGKDVGSMWTSTIFTAVEIKGQGKKLGLREDVGSQLLHLKILSMSLLLLARCNILRSLAGGTSTIAI